MKNLKYLIIGFGLLLSSCAVPVTYFGDTYPATSSVEVYYSAHDLKREYKVIGHMSVNNAGWPQEKIRQRFVDYAKSIGADAVIITGTQATRDNSTAAVNADALKYGN
jgi:hypothetical protein